MKTFFARIDSLYEIQSPTREAANRELYLYLRRIADDVRRGTFPMGLDKISKAEYDSDLSKRRVATIIYHTGPQIVRRKCAYCGLRGTIKAGDRHYCQKCWQRIFPHAAGGKQTINKPYGK